MMRKTVVITADLIKESITFSDRTINQDLLEWFEEAMAPAPWIKEIKIIAVKSF